ncbi:MAG: hypothetical protein H7320_00655 [Ferruginibacter sp.]|nr:hypothetical protein [Ferruginibacter sp.]
MHGSIKIEQFLHENTTWKRLLDFFIQENSFLKTRLSEVVDKQNDALFIIEAERFQNEFILKDEFLQDMWRDIKEQQSKLQSLQHNKQEADSRITKRQQKLRNEIAFLEKDFPTLKNKFNKYLLQ